MEDTERQDRREWVRVYLIGVLMGAAAAVPGVSGGTMALIAGIYTRLVDAVAALPGLARHVPQPGDDIAGVRAALRRADTVFLAVLGLGVATAVVGLSRLVHAALTMFPAPTNALFLGLIAASAVVIHRDVAIDTRRTVAAFLAGAAVAFLLAGVSSGGTLGHPLPLVFLVGAIASAAMLLPGISGSAFLYLLGQYAFLTGTLTRAVDAVAGGALPAPADTAAIASFLAGFAAGVVTVARLVSRALDRAPRMTMAALVGLMVGALRLPAAEIMAATGRWTVPAALVVAAAAVTGAVLVLGVERLAGDVDRSV